MAKPKRMWIIRGGILGCGFKFRHVGLGIQLSGDFVVRLIFVLLALALVRVSFSISNSKYFFKIN